MPSLEELYQTLHVGAENELAGTCLKLWDTNLKRFVEPPYGVDIAETALGDCNLPNMSFQPDQIDKHKKTAIIEHVGGPRKTANSEHEKNLKSACRILVETLKDPQTFKKQERLKGENVTLLTDVLDVYNKKLFRQYPPAQNPPRQNPIYLQFKLKAVAFSQTQVWYVKLSRKVDPRTQLNFEVPFRNLGHIPITGAEEDNDFAQAFTKANHKEMFLACRQKANALVTERFLPIAKEYYQNTQGKTYTYIKLDKLRSLFTLYYYIRAVERTRRKVQKDSYELLPKVGVNDLIRNGLNARDREVLVQVTGNAGGRPVTASRTPPPITFAQLKLDMNKHIMECATILYGDSLSSNLNEIPLDALHEAVFKPEAQHQRYTNETNTAYGNGISATAPKPINDESKYRELRNRPDTPTFKPLQALSYRYDDANKTNGYGQELIIVFESRHDKHPFSRVGKACILVDALTKAHQETVSKLENIQTPYPDRQAKY
jgi:hypothetical protein